MNAIKVRTILAIFLLFSLILVVSGRPATAATPLVTVSGGGRATFDPGEELEGLETKFSVGAQLNEDGSAAGHFNCLIEGVVVLTGDVLSGHMNPDGSVTLEGLGTVVDLEFGIFRNEPFSVTMEAGGPGEGHFVYTDVVTGPAGDAETVSHGQIMINTH